MNKRGDSHALPKYRFITTIMDEKFIPSSIIEFETREKNEVYITPEIKE